MIHAEADDATVNALTELGHKVQRSGGSLWAPSAIRLEGQGRLEAAGDPRSGRHAAAY